MKIKSIIKNYLSKKLNLKAENTINLNLLIEADKEFNQLYNQGSKITNTPDAVVGYKFSKRWMRFYNLLQFYNYVIDLDGEVAECGCWLGLSSYLINQTEKKINKNYTGKKFNIIDSFEGLSAPTPEDLAGDYVPQKGSFNSNLESVKYALSEFKDINYYKGWIPQILNQIPEKSYKFIHIDLDLYEPIKTATEYFYPRLVSGGIIVFDDYGSNLWPGAKKAIDNFCNINNIKLLALSTGQSVIIKK